MENYVNKIINNNICEDNMFFWLYPFTNENIDGYFSHINFKNKDVLTVTSSGDHILNAFVYGAKTIDAFDINPLARYYVELKIAAIKALTREEFIGFFYSNTKLFTPKLFFNKKLYEKVKKSLFGMVRLFWDKVFDKYDAKKINKSKLFTTDFSDLDGLLEANIYLQEKSYYYLKRVINSKHINYYNIDINNLNTINKQYDIIVLSNIPATLHDDNCLEKLKKNLDIISKPDSVIVLNYNYSNFQFNDELPAIYDINKVKKIFSNLNVISFPSSEKYIYPKFIRKIIKFEDSVLVHKKKLVK